MSVASTEIADSPFPSRRFTRAEFNRMAETGLFEDERVELLNGVISPMTPQGPQHGKCIKRLTMTLVPQVLGRADVAVQLPFAASEDSQPEPDLYVLPLECDEEDAPPSTPAPLHVATSTSSPTFRIETSAPKH